MSGSLALGFARAPASLRGLFEELSDLKRVRSAGRKGSIAERGFASAWCGLSALDDPRDVMLATVSRALCAARLGDLDGEKLRGLGLAPDAASAILRRGFDEVERGADDMLRTDLRGAITTASPRTDGIPAFVGLLAAQPRAGATCPGRPRLMLEPPESHAEHCWAVAVFGVLLAPVYGADPVTVFVAALAHHLHNTIMPDSGFTGEMLLGDHLEAACAQATREALEQLPPVVRARVEAARAILKDADTPEGRAFHAADVIDRVMQMAQHLRGASVTMAMVLDDMGLVHDGPVKAFHDRVLAEMGLP